MIGDILLLNLDLKRNNMKKPETIEEYENKCEEMFYLLIECRDALPAITIHAARLHRVRLDLDKRIEACIECYIDPNGI